MKTIDLHTHSSCSDGTLSPSEVIYEAYKAGLSAVALTDHDTADGLREAARAAALLNQSSVTSDSGISNTIEFIPGIELSISLMERELHIVGLHLNINSPAFEQALKKLQENRTRRNEAMVLKMQSCGVDITMEKLIAHQGNGVLTRANFARYLLETGFISSISEGFDKYLSPGKPFYIPREYMSPESAITLIHSVGGLAILAHPLLYHFTDAQLESAVSVLKNLGLDGLEAYYSMNTDMDTVHMKSLAKRHGLLLSGGSDFHGSNKPHISIGRGRGHLFIPYDVLEKQKEALLK